MSVQDVWLQALPRIEAKLGSTPSFKAMFEPSRLIALEAGQAVIEVPNGFVRDHMKRNHHDALLSSVLEELAGEPVTIEFVLAASEPAAREREREPEAAPPWQVPAPERRPANGPVVGILNPRYTFSSFVIGGHSRMAHAAAVAVAESPARAYNPLFIYGDVGLGKTHLMQAIAHHLLDKHPDMRVAYLSSEKFTNELVNAIKEDRMMDFKKRYRQIDLLLVDDIQFMAGKEATQEEFFHTFNELHGAGKQIVISSDRPPREIAALEDRLRNRFEQGLITDVGTPDLETRIAILKKKADVDAISVSDDVLQYIATAYTNNVRELEGAFIRVVAYASLSHEPLSMGLAQRALGTIVAPRQVSVPIINEAVAEHYHLEVADLVGSRRTKDISLARQVAMYLARELTELSLNVIGSKYGGRDHTTVMHAVDKVKTQLGKDLQLTADVQKLTTRLKG
ncbi:MAG: chromosomal replication initiator protein DnaA [Candidatus Sericytochromatia bacterium]|nr:chromosomal replication initiator protein DnaA [Candidatus Sericytochromatia bacterium]